MEQAIKGWCILTNTISGVELVWRYTSNELDYPLIYPTEHDAQKAIVDSIEDDIQEWKDSEREFDEIKWVDEYQIAQIEVFEDGSLIVWEDGVSGDVRHGIIETTLTDWRKSL